MAEKTPSKTAEESTREEAGMSKETGQKWITRIEGRIKTFKEGWWKCARAAQEMYNLEKGYDPAKKNPFNVLYANTEVLQPALYSNTPRPDVRTRFDWQKNQVAEAVDNLLVATIDDNTPGTATFDEGMDSAVLGALVPGMGFVRLRHYPKAVCPFQYESGAYDQLIWGFATSWNKVPWISFEHVMTKEQIISEFEIKGKEEQDKIKIEKQEDKDQKDFEQEPTCNVHELWIKSEKKVVFLCSEYEGKVLREVEDVLEIEGFYPTPGLLTILHKNKSLDPTPLYEYYKEQAEELNRVTVRLKHVLSAIKVRGVYNPILGEVMKQLLSDEYMENALSPANIPMDMQSKGFDAHVWTLPVQDLITVAQQLYLARQQILQVIYQITGIADIVRGSSAASETASAQQIKDKWSGVRLRRAQRLVGNYARDLLRITVDAATNVLSPKEWARITQLKFPFQKDKERAQAALQQLAEQTAQMQQMAQGDPTAQPPQPPQPPPELVETAQQMSWEEILALLKSDEARAYVIDIETYSTIDPDAQIDKQEVAEFMQAMGGMMTGLAPLATMPGGVEVGKELLIAVAGKYKLGRSVQSALAKLQPPTTPDGEPQPEDHSVEVAMINAQNKIKITEMQAQADERITRLEGQIKMMLEQMKNQAKVQIEEKKVQAESQMRGQELQADVVLHQQDSMREEQARREDMAFQASQGEQDRSFQREQGAQDRAFQDKQARRQDATARKGMQMQSQDKRAALKSKPSDKPRR